MGGDGAKVRGAGTHEEKRAWQGVGPGKQAYELGQGTWGVESGESKVGARMSGGETWAAGRRT